MGAEFGWQDFSGRCGRPLRRLLYRLKRPWRDGTTHVVFQPQELLEKLAALVPAPRAHSVRYSGVFAPAAAWRPLVIPDAAATTAADDDSAPEPVERCSGVTGASTMTPVAISPEAPATTSERHERNYTWSELMKRVWGLDVLKCPRCHGPMRLLAAIHPPDATRRILECLGLPSRAPPIARAVSDLAVS